MNGQRCTECLRDLPDGSPSRCEQCRKEDAKFCSERGLEIHFCAPACLRGGSEVDDDPDAYRRAYDQD